MSYEQCWIINRDLDMIKYLIKRGYRHPGNALELAASHGYLEILEYIHETSISQSMCTLRTSCASSGAVDTTDAMNCASRYGRLEIVKYLCEKMGATCVSGTTNAMDSAAANGHLEIVKYLHGTGFTCTTAAMDKAAANGHLNVLKYLHEKVGAKCSVDAMDNVCSYPRQLLEIIKYLNEKVGAKYTRYGLHYASENGYLEIVKYLQAEAKIVEILPKN